MTDFDDIQGLLRFGYKHHTEAVFVLLRVADRGAACAWLAQVRVGNAAKAQPPATVLQVALSVEGLRALGVDEDTASAFAPEFVAGLGPDANRARRLGDVGPNDPQTWQWGGSGAERVPHVVALLYALPGHLAGFRMALDEQWRGAFVVVQSLPTSDMRGVEPFGFVDGVSQPALDWERERVVEDEDQLVYGNLACLGEFVLGYPNEYGRYTDRPLLDTQAPSASLLPRAEDAPARADLGRNGSYLVLRTLRQDVSGFWRFLDAQSQGQALPRRQLAEAMVGRTLEGRPLVDPAPTPIVGVGAEPGELARNSFTFDQDRDGLRCPLGAHVRRSNPRNGDLPPGVTGLLSRAARILGFDADGLRSDIIASTRFHRVLRRGREYGVRLTVDQAIATDAPVTETGLQFVCLCADLSRQFEFVQGAWIAGSKFAGLPHETDPLLGNRQPVQGQSTDRFSIPRRGCPTREIDGMPNFVDVLGGAYFFLPGIRALRYLAAVGSSAAAPPGAAPSAIGS